MVEINTLVLWGAYFYAGFVLFMAQAEGIKRSFSGEMGGRLFALALCLCLWPLYPIAYLLDD